MKGASTAYADRASASTRGLRNRLLNGDFRINQWGRAATSTTYAAGTVIMDRWKAGSGGVTLSFAAASNGDVTVTITAGTLVQVIEGAIYLPEGGSYTFSRAGTATCRAYQGTASGSYAASPFTVASWTAGTNGAVECSTGTLSLAQFEPGTAATAFERRDGEVERCLRYLEKSYDSGIAPGTAGVAIEQGKAGVTLSAADLYDYGFVTFLREKGGAPTIQGYSPSDGTANWYDQNAAANVGAIKVSNVTRKRFRLSNNNANWTVNHVVAAGWVASWEPTL